MNLQHLSEAFIQSDFLRHRCRQMEFCPRTIGVVWCGVVGCLPTLKTAVLSTTLHQPLHFNTLKELVFHLHQKRIQRYSEILLSQTLNTNNPNEDFKPFRQVCWHPWSHISVHLTLNSLSLAFGLSLMASWSSSICVCAGNYPADLFVIKHRGCGVSMN